MSTSKYTWKMQALAKGIDAEAALQELERIEREFGSITADIVLEVSKDPSAILHKIFTWDDSKAAHQYRLSQARSLINNIEVVVISDGEQKHIPVYEIVTLPEGRVYKNIKDLTRDDLQQLKLQAVKELNGIRTKLSNYDSFSKSIAKIDEAVEEIKNVKYKEAV